MNNQNIALIDLDSTLVNFHDQLKKDLLALKSPEEPDIDYFNRECIPEYIENRASLIKRIPGWWRNLPKYEPGFEILNLLRELEYSLNIYSKGPTKATNAWTEKFEWVQENVPDALVTLTQDKGLTYGKVLADDWPPFIKKWLEWRPRGLVIMPDHPWNKDFNHHQVFRYCGKHNLQELRELLVVHKNR